MFSSVFSSQWQSPLPDSIQLAANHMTRRGRDRPWVKSRQISWNADDNFTNLINIYCYLFPITSQYVLVERLAIPEQLQDGL